MLGSVSIIEPQNPNTNDYWYSIDDNNETVTLKKYNGTTWEPSDNLQQLSYYWSQINTNGSDIPMGQSEKVKIISANDFTSTATFKCDVESQENGFLTMDTLTLTDTSDPIISDTAPQNVQDGQIWIKKNDNGTYMMFIWDAAEENWISADADSNNKIYTSRPSQYNVGDLWITNSDEDHGTYLQGTLLQAQTSNTTYNADDWTPTLKYDMELDDIHETLNNLSQYVRINSQGLQIGAKTDSGEISPFTSLFTNTELAFYQDSDKLLTLANNQLIAPKVTVENNLNVQGTINLGNMYMTIEDNGSFSFTVLN